jgi:hypothetical protein
MGSVKKSSGVQSGHNRGNRVTDPQPVSYMAQDTGNTVLALRPLSLELKASRPQMKLTWKARGKHLCVCLCSTVLFGRWVHSFM